MSSTAVELQTIESSGPSYTAYPPTSGTSLKRFADVEVRSALTDSSDPFSFRSALKSDHELTELRKRSKTGKHIEKYQRGQNDLISNLLKPMEAHTAEAKEAEAEDRLPVRIAVWASLLANVALSALQLYAAISSGSLSLLATCIDSVFDPGSNLILYWLHKKASKLDTNKWPVGGSRLETIGNISYGALMAAVNLVILVESVRALADHGGAETNELHIPSIVAVAAAFGVKFALFLYCYALRNSSSQVRMLWEDHRNDLFINGFGILTSAGGAKLKWWLDPAGALIIATGVMISWTRTIYGEFELLAGKSAPHEFLQLVIYKAATFSDEIQALDTVRAYHSGPNYFVEIDIVMDADTPLWKAHDISQQLQDKLETLPGVERAFVHVDHETTHRPEHRKYD
ncbi:cation diffusion facilitator family transporter [Rhizoctonia solani AG-3 Rhs1AP]|uniref:Cation diffusion facilitator family transporter n=2 Tax=Rhizoctonia solani AG-3 TaxID=1086053 RepID=A0A074SDU6_9AGAM|nr:cation diffusion facilitator family transporter [Rhizoctonia solani AG-3 Rhs1AP]KEP55013.1 cation diffusion facilitator family transporter [Rhizoctonia solani 123E]